MERLTNTRFESLDAMRGLASLAVVIFHIGSNEFQNQPNKARYN